MSHMQPINTLCVQNAEVLLSYRVVHIVTTVLNRTHSCVHYSLYITLKKVPTTHSAQSRPCILSITSWKFFQTISLYNKSYLKTKPWPI
jgi:hypothetical protein